MKVLNAALVPLLEGSILLSPCFCLLKFSSTQQEQVQRVVASIEASTNSNSNSSSNQSVPNSLNSNIRTLSFNGVDETRVINGGVKMPENIANEEDIIKWEI